MFTKYCFLLEFRVVDTLRGCATSENRIGASTVAGQHVFHDADVGRENVNDDARVSPLGLELDELRIGGSARLYLETPS